MKGGYNSLTLFCREGRPVPALLGPERTLTALTCRGWMWSATPVPVCKTGLHWLGPPLPVPEEACSGKTSCPVTNLIDETPMLWERIRSPCRERNLQKATMAVALRSRYQACQGKNIVVTLSSPGIWLQLHKGLPVRTTQMSQQSNEKENNKLLF